MASTDKYSPTPTKKAKTEESQSPPSFKTDGISPEKPHLRREDTVTEIFNEAIRCQHVVVGSPPASGKTSLLQLLKIKLIGLDKDVPQILRLNLTSDRSVEDLMQELATYGVTRDVRKLEQLKNTWILIDDAQNAYDTKFNPFWEFVVKHISSVVEIAEELRIVIASTYDLSTPNSPVNFGDLAHIQPNATETEARELFQIYAEQMNCHHMSRFRETLVDISKLTSEMPGLSPPESPQYHLGIVMAGLRVLADNKKTLGVHVLVEDAMLQELRGAGMLEHLKRCFKLPKDLSPTFQEYLLDAVTEESECSVEFTEQKELKPFLRSGILSRTGKFRSIAAQWYYNKMCFPDRAARRPEQLDDLVKLSVQSLSARRLRDAATAGFPKEATFQHLFNEAMSKQLPIQHGIIPELNTFANNEEESIITGELDFYINGSLKWALELLRNGDKIGEHLKRFDPTIGKYRKVIMRDYLVIDCRPKKQSSVQLADNRCTLFFADDFKHCICQMRMEEELKLILAH